MPFPTALSVYSLIKLTAPSASYSYSQGFPVSMRADHPLFGGGYCAVIYKSELDKAASDIGCNVHFPVTFFRTAKDFLRVRGFLSVIGFNNDGEAVISGQPCRDGVGLMTADEKYGFPGYGMKRAVVTVPSGFGDRNSDGYPAALSRRKLCLDKSRKLRISVRKPDITLRDRPCPDIYRYLSRLRI